MFLLVKTNVLDLNSLSTLIKMKIIRRTRAIFAVLLGMASSLILSAQERILVDVEKPELVALDSPQIQAGGVDKSFDPKQWLEFEVELEVTRVQPANAKFVDNLTVKWYVSVLDENRKPLLLQKEVEHVNVPIGEEIFSSVYLSPSAVLRLTGDERVNSNSVKYVGGEIIFNGQLVKSFILDGKLDKPFWKSANVSLFNKVPLRSKDETPFANLWWDRYAENKVKNN